MAIGLPIIPEIINQLEYLASSFAPIGYNYMGLNYKLLTINGKDYKGPSFMFKQNGSVYSDDHEVYITSVFFYQDAPGHIMIADDLITPLNSSVNELELHNNKLHDSTYNHLKTSNRFNSLTIDAYKSLCDQVWTNVYQYSVSDEGHILMISSIKSIPTFIFSINAILTFKSLIMSVK